MVASPEIAFGTAYNVVLDLVKPDPDGGLSPGMRRHGSMNLVSAASRLRIRWIHMPQESRLGTSEGQAN